MINLLFRAFFHQMSTNSFVDTVTSSLNRVRNQIRSIISDLGSKLTRQSSQSEFKSRTYSDLSETNSSTEGYETKSFGVGQAWEKYVLIDDVWVPKQDVASYDRNTVWEDCDEIPDEDDDEDKDVFYDARTECYDPDLESSTSNRSAAGPSKDDALTPSASTPSFEERFKAIDRSKKVIDVAKVKSLQGLPETCTVQQVADFINTTLGTFAKAWNLLPLLSKKGDLELLGKAVSESIDPNDEKFSCLAFHAFVFSNPKNREHLRAVLNSNLMKGPFVTENGAKLSEIFPKANFEENKALIEGFAKYLKVDSEKVLAFFKNENWEGLLRYLSDENSYNAA